MSTEREALARVIGKNLDLDPSAHPDSMIEDLGPCRGCLAVADAILAAGYARRTSAWDWRKSEEVQARIEEQEARLTVNGHPLTCLMFTRETLDSLLDLVAVAAFAAPDDTEGKL